ncbi:acyl-coenzyme A thioesterase 9, mitochondrial isoform X3 [Ahaetulla prasina]|uniref:acyl-coenzyme A thioesterase 9, mitochondrial isoform X3 n=1 Tax=Ahaetulla prasina TaxID=499056 RepID=UPI0026495FF8|nr:acyl-coenzyme A thioesterase 9, mitochondrial isoform X3 [Ahaetulla prasina]
MLSRRWFSLSKPHPILFRMLTSSGSGSQVIQNIEEGHFPIHVNSVRSKLRELVGASTNWRDHVQVMNERKSLHTLLAKTQADLPPRKMKDSYIDVILPLGSQPEIREKYLNMQNTVRFGRILEDLDSLGVLICYTHTKNEATLRSPLSIVTALVDKIGITTCSDEYTFLANMSFLNFIVELQPPSVLGCLFQDGATEVCLGLWKQYIHPDCDIKFTGNVSWVGKTSMEVKIHMLQLLDAVYSPVLDATFVMVARDPENKRPAFVNPLIAETPEEEKILKEGEKNKIRRLESSRASLLKVAPTADERNIIHNMFLNTLDSRTVSFRSRVLLPNSVWMQDTKLKGLEICHPQVCYTKKNNIQVRVHSEVYDPETRVHHTTNVFHFTFMIEKEIPDVVPKTYGESMLYLDGKRHFDSVMKENTT